MKLSLRARLLTVLIVLLVLALAASDVATYKVLRRQLIRDLDQQLEVDEGPFERALSNTRSPTPSEPPASAHRVEPRPTAAGLPSLFSDPVRLRALLPPMTYLSVRDPSGAVLVEVPGGGSGSEPPRVSDRTLRDAVASPESVRLLSSLPATGGGARYRTVAEALPRGILILARPLTGLNKTLHRLAAVELIVTAVALLAVSLLALWLVRVGLSTVIVKIDDFRVNPG